jgi:hypothetical protein
MAPPETPSSGRADNTLSAGAAAVPASTPTAPGPDGGSPDPD